MSLSTAPLGGVGITLASVTGGGSSVPYPQLRDDCEFGGFETAVIPLPVLSATTLAKTSGRSDYGTFSGSMWLVMSDAGVIAMAALFAARTMSTWTLKLNDDAGTIANSSTAVFTGFVSKFTPGNFTGEDAPTVEFEIAISGAVTLTAGT